MGITQIRLLPPLALARLGSSPEPLENYELEVTDAVGPRSIVPAETLHLDASGAITTSQRTSGPVQFRDAEHRIKPVAPFFELYARVDGAVDWVPVTETLLAAHGLTLAAVSFSAHLGNIKIERRTGDAGDRIEGRVAPFSDHATHPVDGQCANFLDGVSIPLGHVQFARPDARFPGLRVRFTPAHGKVYGTVSATPDPNVAGAVYDGTKGGWARYSEPDSPTNDYDGRRLTNPAEIFAGHDEGGRHYSYGYVDDECDGTISAHLDVAGQTLTAFARVAAGPPTFAPDSKPIRTVADELAQALHGPDVPATSADIEAARDIVRRALETVRLMNTGQLNKGGVTRGVGMARMDVLDVSRESAPIFDPTVAESLAIRTRHERVLLALESGSLVWFARILRHFDEVGDLSDEGRRRMPGLMRNADGRNLALTRRQVSTIEAAADYIVKMGGGASPGRPAIQPLNLSAQLAHRAQGNPPNSMTDTAISNAYPGLEMDFRNVWKRILEGIVLHESLNFVLDAEAGFAPLKGMFVLEIGGVRVTAPVTGPNADGVQGPLVDQFGDDHMALEWSNVLATIVRDHQGKSVRCVFRAFDGKLLERDLVVRRFFEADSAVISAAVIEPGALTQSLCAPWQNDYRECSCFYWAANRPDYVNVEPRADGTSAGHNWMQRDRTSTTPKVYINDDWQDPRLLSHTDLVSDWEQALRFVIGNKDEPAGS